MHRSLVYFLLVNAEITNDVCYNTTTPQDCLYYPNLYISLTDLKTARKYQLYQWVGGKKNN